MAPATPAHSSDMARSYKSSGGARANSGYSDGESMFENVESRSRYEAYSRLQASAVAFGEKLPIPEIVAIGGQSDGKSSLLEALLGFRFNIREVEMGTRRPLMLQMIHDPSALEPRCRLQEENSDDYGPAIDPPSAIAEAVRARTEAHLRQLGGGAAVSAKPIVMRAEYAYCPNLTIIDSPGFVLNARKGEPDNTPEAIMGMVKALVMPPHRLILFLQQSSVEWVSSLWLDVVREVDPTFRRTVIVASKFDNRLKEFAERWEVDRYLSANGILGENVKPFFVALPKDRSIPSNAEFRRQIAAVDVEIMRQLREGISGGFDTERFGSQIGFGNLRKFLELELQRRYRDAAPATLALLEHRCGEVAEELSLADARLATTGDIAGLRRASMMHASSVTCHVVALLDGTADPDPAEWGRTSDEEREESGVGRWPGVMGDVKPTNANLRLYGGAAFERVLDEFRCAAFSLECPPVSREKVANILLAHGGRQGGPAAAAADIARQAARVWLGPLLDAVCDRLAHIVRSLFELALHRHTVETEGEPGSADGKIAASTLSAFVGFHAALRRAHDRFIRQLSVKCKDRARHHLTAGTSPFAPVDSWEPLTSPHQAPPFGEPYNNLLYDDNGNLGATGHPNLEATTPPLANRTGHEEGENGHAGGAGGRQSGRGGSGGSPPEDGLEHLRESQATVPETPSPDQGINEQAAAKRKEYAAASGRMSVLGNSHGGPGSGMPNGGGGDLGGILKRFNTHHGGGDANGQKKRPSGSGAMANGSANGSGNGFANGNGVARYGNGKAPKMLTHGSGYGSAKSAYTEVCGMVVEQFGRIREIVVHRLVPSTLSAGFISPCRERLGVSVALELFACTDEDFMDMFVAPGAVEMLQASRSALQKRSETLQACMQEFRTLARSL